MSFDSLTPRRRQPRRQFRHNVGLLVRGQYFVTAALQIGEGGMLLTSHQELKTGQKLVVTFKLPDVPPAVVRGSVRYALPHEAAQGQKYGIAFDNLETDAKKAIRTYVALKPKDEFLDNK